MAAKGKEFSICPVLYPISSLLVGFVKWISAIGEADAAMHVLKAPCFGKVSIVREQINIPRLITWKNYCIPNGQQKIEQLKAIIRCFIPIG